jgi:hypothetical protein
VGEVLLRHSEALGLHKGRTVSRQQMLGAPFKPCLA